MYRLYSHFIPPVIPPSSPGIRYHGHFPSTCFIITYSPRVHSPNLYLDTASSSFIPVLRFLPHEDVLEASDRGMIEAAATTFLAPLTTKHDIAPQNVSPRFSVPRRCHKKATQRTPHCQLLTVLPCVTTSKTPNRISSDLREFVFSSLLLWKLILSIRSNLY